MQILIISGSPRRQGNSGLLCDEFARGVREKGHSVEKINLQEKEIRSCLACYACFQTGACVQSDDMADVLAKICAAQVLVLASPTYFLTMSGPLKVMIDRLLPKWQDLGGKDVYIIVTGHDSKSGLLRVGDDLAAIWTSLGAHVRQIIYGDHVWKKGEVLGTPAMEEAYAAGQCVGHTP